MPETISIGQVIRLMDGRVALTPCARQTDLQALFRLRDAQRLLPASPDGRVCHTTDDMLNKTSWLDLVNDEHSMQVVI